MNRRTLFAGASLLALAGCGLFTSKTVNGVTTYTVDVGRLDKLVQATVSALSGFVDLPFVPISAQMTFAMIADIITTDSAAFAKAAGGLVVLTFDSSSIPAGFQSVVADAQKIFADVSASLPQTALTGTAMQVVSAIKTAVLLIEAMVPAMTPAAATRAAVSPN